MISLILCLIGHRTFLWFVALVSLTGDFTGIFSLSRHGELWRACLDRVAVSAEGIAVASHVSGLGFAEIWRDPFIELAYWFCQILHLSPAFGLIVLSNIFFILFILEVYRVVSTSTMPEMATATAILAVLWPASFELGLGSRVAFEAWLLAAGMRSLLDNRWLYVGLTFGGFFIYNHSGVWFLPLIVYFFLYFQQHFQKSVVLRRALLFIVPFGLALWLTHFSIREIWSQWRGSFLSQLFPPTQLLSIATTYGWAHFLGQLISLGLIVLGAVLTITTPLLWLYRAIPLSLGIFALAFIPWGMMGSRGVIAAIALHGLSENMDRTRRTFLEAVLVFFGAVEIYRVFH